MAILPGCSSTSPEMEEDNSNVPVLLDSGDVRLYVRYSNRSLTWSAFSSNLAQVSPVWNKMLNSPFPKISSKEGGDGGMQAKSIDFTDDSAEALLILLRIAHCQFSKIPSRLELETILHMAVLCDKYDCVGLVKPWLNSWLVNEWSQYDRPGNEQWLFIAWVFGKEQIFEASARKLQREMTVDDCGEPLTSTGESFSSPMPAGIIENMISIRESAIKDLFKVTYDYLDLFLSGNKTVCCQPSCRKACDALVCGSLIIGLNALGLWPQKSPDTINLSLRDLMSKIESLVIWNHPANNFSDHYNCGSVAFSDRLESLLSSIPDPVLESHRRHMRAQNMK